MKTLYNLLVKKKTLTLLHQFIQQKKEHQIEGDPYGIINNFFRLCNKLVEEDDISPQLLNQYDLYIMQLLKSAKDNNIQQVIEHCLCLSNHIGTSLFFFNFSIELPFLIPNVDEFKKLHYQLLLLKNLLYDFKKVKDRKGFINWLCKRDNLRKNDINIDIQECYKNIKLSLKALGISITKRELFEESIGIIRKKIIEQFIMKAKEKQKKIDHER